MPLVKGYSAAAVAHNVALMLAEEKPHRQAIAIARSKAETALKVAGLKWTQKREDAFQAGVRKATTGSAKRSKKAATRKRRYIVQLRYRSKGTRGTEAAIFTLAAGRVATRKEQEHGRTEVRAYEFEFLTSQRAGRVASDLEGLGLPGAHIRVVDSLNPTKGSKQTSKQPDLKEGRRRKPLSKPWKAGPSFAPDIVANLYSKRAGKPTSEQTIRIQHRKVGKVYAVGWSGWFTSDGSFGSKTKEEAIALGKKIARYAKTASGRKRIALNSLPTEWSVVGGSFKRVR